MAEEFMQLLGPEPHDFDTVQSVISNQLTSGLDSRIAARAALSIYSSAQTPDIRFLEIAINCMEILKDTAGGLSHAEDLGLYMQILGARYAKLGQLQDLEDCIAYGSAACDEAQIRRADYSSSEAGWLGILGTHLSYRYQQRGNLEDLEAAISRTEAAVGATPGSDPDRAGWLSNLGTYFSCRYVRTGNLKDLDAAIAHTEAAVEATPEDHPDLANWLGNLGTHFSCRYDRTENMKDLDAAISCIEAVVEATPESDPDRARNLCNLGTRIRCRYDTTGNLKDLDAAIAHTEAAVEATPEDHPDLAIRLRSLGTHFSCRYVQTRNLEDLDAAIGRIEAAVEAMPESDPDRARRLSNLGFHLKCRYDTTGNLKDLDAAIARIEAAVEATPESDPGRAALFGNIGELLRSRYQLIGNPKDSEAAITHAESAVEATSEDHPDRASWLGHLANALEERYERTWNLEDLEAAIAHVEAAVEATPEDHPARARRLCNLGAKLSNRYERTRSLADLEAAIACNEAAVEATPESNPDRAGLLGDLGEHLLSRYRGTGNLKDLEDAIAYVKVAVEATSEDDPARADRLGNLANALEGRYERTLNLKDLEDAIACGEAAVEATPEDHPDLAMWLNNLGNFLAMRYQRRTLNLKDLDDAIACSEAALAATPEDHPSRAGWLSNLGTHLNYRYIQTNNLENLNAAIACTEAAVETTPEDHGGRALYLGNLGMYLFSRYEGTGNIDLKDLEAAITHAEAAVDATPENHPDRGKWHNLCSRLYYVLEAHGHSGALGDTAQKALTSSLASWSMSNAPILQRLFAAQNASEMLVFNHRVKDLSRACSLLHDAVLLMPLASLRSLEREEHEYILGHLAGLPSLAAAVSLEIGQSPLEALKLLELGRSITNAQLLDYRSDISDLMAKYPTLGNHFNTLRLELDSPFPSTASSDLPFQERIRAQQILIERRYKVAEDLNDTLEQIRQKPEFENFLRAESKEYLLSAAQEGPIVVLNATRLRSDAILITKEQITSLSLPLLSVDAVKKHLGASTGTPIDEDIVKRYLSADPRDNETQRKLLDWLWKSAVQPVLQKLGFYPKALDPLPRVWWIGVGEILAQAPLHAASKYRKGSLKMTTLQYCIPSYTSTIRALQHSRSRLTQLPASIGDILIVTMPTTPGESDLDVDKEADDIRNTWEETSGAVQILRRPTAAGVLQALPSYGIAHFACHGVSSINPGASHLLLVKQSTLHDESDEEEVDRLSVKEEVDMLSVTEVAALKLPAARLAYLSACCTANSPKKELADEVTHIVSSFHIAGFIHVIGTLWESEDEACQKMAMDFYSRLSKTENVAVSYRNAVMGLIAEKASQPIYWAPFIHFGA